MRPTASPSKPPKTRHSSPKPTSANTPPSSFSNSNNEAFSTPAQREAFQHYIQSGGGYVGIHSRHRLRAQLGLLPTGRRRQIPPPPPENPALPRNPQGPPPPRSPRHLHLDRRVLLPHQPEPRNPPHPHHRPRRRRRPQIRRGPRPTPSTASAPWPGIKPTEEAAKSTSPLGHQPEHYRNPLFLNLILRAILWAMN